MIQDLFQNFIFINYFSYGRQLVHLSLPISNIYIADTHTDTDADHIDPNAGCG